MGTPRIAVCMIAADDPFRRLLEQEAAVAASQAAALGTIVFTGERCAEHRGEYQAFITTPAGARQAIVVMTGDDQRATAAAPDAETGTPAIAAGPDEDDIETIRRRFPSAFVSVVRPGEPAGCGEGPEWRRPSQR
jgi:hypothetical protein